jgi:hypothetical protein
MSVKNSSDTIGNRTRDLPAYSAVPSLAILTEILEEIAATIFRVFQEFPQRTLLVAP